MSKLFRISLYLLMTSAINAQAQTPTSDLAQRYTDIHWPDSHNPATADIFAHNDIFIDASCKSVWTKLVTAEDWPHWYANASNVQIDNGNKSQLQKNAIFTWSTFGLAVESRVAEFKPYRRLAWYGKTDKLDGYHTWYLSSQGGGCKVITEEAVKGEAARTWRQQDEGAMHKGHELWLGQLKQAAEKTRHP